MANVRPGRGFRSENFYSTTISEDGNFLERCARIFSERSPTVSRIQRVSGAKSRLKSIAYRPEVFVVDVRGAWIGSVSGWDVRC